MTAKYIFERVKPGTIKFVLIGLAPNAFCYDNAEDFSTCPHNIQYMFALNLPAHNRHDELLQALISDDVKNILASVKAEQADLNFDGIKLTHDAQISAQALLNWAGELKNLKTKFYPETVAKNFQILKDYIKLCLDNGAKPVGVVLPFAPIMRQNFSKELLTLFRLAIRQLEESYEFMCVDLFDLNLGYDCFYNMAHLNLRGAAISSALLGVQLYEKNLIAAESFCNMNYEYFNLLSIILPKENYNALVERVFAESVQKIRRKKKIKVAFVIYNAAMWCGDDLYKLFAKDSRFETKVFACLELNNFNKLVEQDFWIGVKQLKSRGLNVVTLLGEDAAVPKQDVIFFLTPYLDIRVPDALKFSALTAETLTVYLPYFFDTSNYAAYNFPIMRIAWKIFFDSDISLKIYDKKCLTGMPRAQFSGMPKLDVFFKRNANFRFNWKKARSGSKKIIWAPHYSIVGVPDVRYATFQWNFKFMYEFAKAHSETSWVVKPHPELLFAAVQTGLFPSVEAFEEYLQAWNDLPNAQVYTGAYYHEIFATSDGMILDSSSFIGEYQYTHKPMIFLTREGTTDNLHESFNELGEELMEIIYRIDGRDLNGIAALMQRIFIKGDDQKRAERQKFFDKHLNYYKQNSMTAGEFIYREVVRSLKK